MFCVTLCNSLFWCATICLTCVISKSVDPGSISLSSRTKDFRNDIHSIPVWLAPPKKVAWRKVCQDLLLCPFKRHMTGFFHFYVA